MSMRVAMIVQEDGTPVLGWLDDGPVITGDAANKQLLDRIGEEDRQVVLAKLLSNLANARAASEPDQMAYSSVASMLDEVGELEIMLVHADPSKIDCATLLLNVSVLIMALQHHGWAPSDLHVTDVIDVQVGNTGAYDIN